MTLEQHQKDTKKLYRLEQQLEKLIMNTNDGNVLSKFYLWQDQRKVCNKGFMDFIIETLK